MGPAGTVHCSLVDWAKFVGEHVRGERGEKTLLPLTTAEWRALHAPPSGGDYALGWGIGHAPWASGPILTHDGSNTLYYASVLASPKDDLIFLCATNRGDEIASHAVHDVIDFLVETRGRH